MEAHRKILSDDKSRILIVDDDELLSRFLSLLLDAVGYVVKTAHDGDEGLNIMEEFAPDLVLVDYMMPVIDGITFCKTVRSNPRFSTTYLTMLSAREDGQVEGLDIGADDYLIKPVKEDVLLAQVRKGIRAVKQRVSVYTDPETGLWSRPFFQSLLETEIYRAERYRSKLALMIIRFEDAGQCVDASSEIRAMVDDLKLRKADMVGRWTSDQLAIALPHTSADVGEILMQRLVGKDGAAPLFNYTGMASVDIDHSRELVAIAEGSLFESTHQDGVLMINGEKGS